MGVCLWEVLNGRDTIYVDAISDLIFGIGTQIDMVKSFKETIL